MPYKPTGKKAGRPRKTPTKTATPKLAPVEPVEIDPRAVLAEIAADKEAPAGARVQAAKALMGRPGQPPAQPDDEPPMDEVTRRALAIMQRSGRPN
ncbi:hypothetical protein [Devosia sp. XK-2]|uniref:hypothetical protein n=1 Tax=Devosia sp. XK-2 TaxID=3126689 RepID=UPI0030CAE9ED